MGRIDHVELFVPDRYQAASWYRRSLGLEIVAAYEFWAKDPQGPLMISADAGDTKLALFSGTPQGSRPSAGYHRVAFRMDAPEFLEFLARIDELELLEDGTRVQREAVRDHGKSYSIYFTDPWGHRLEVTSYAHEQISEALRRSS